LLASISFQLGRRLLHLLQAPKGPPEQQLKHGIASGLLAGQHSLPACAQAADAAAEALPQAGVVAGRVVVQQPLVPQQQVDAVLASLQQLQQQQQQQKQARVM
jgi:hypothetical protein